jgi:hypothetical protein
MPAWNITTIIAGVDFSNCQALIVDGQKRASDYVGSIITAADGTKHRQRVKTGGVGKSVGRNYGVNLPQVEATLVQAALAAIATAEDANIPFRVQMETRCRRLTTTYGPTMRRVIGSLGAASLRG